MHQITISLLFQIGHSHYIFVDNFSNFNPRIGILLFLDSAKAGRLKNVQNQFLRCFRIREISKTKVGPFFLTHPVAWQTLHNWPNPINLSDIKVKGWINLILFYLCFSETVRIGQICLPILWNLSGLWYLRINHTFLTFDIQPTTDFLGIRTIFLNHRDAVKNQPL